MVVVDSVTAEVAEPRAVIYTSERAPEKRGEDLGVN